MQIIIQDTVCAAVELITRIIARELMQKPDLVLGLATGRTMESVYSGLVAMHTEKGLDFARCRTFNLDEYAGITPDDPDSYRSYMNRHFFEKVNVCLNNTHLPDGTAKNLNLECAAYEDAIKKAGGIDLQLLGIGQNGHIGFNEPLSSLGSRTRVVPLSSETIAQNSSLFKSPAKMPRLAITMGVGTILESKQCLLLATGSGKADIVAKAFEGPVTSMVSASSLQFHPNCTIILDKTAASKLETAEYSRWVFENAPEWRE